MFKISNTAKAVAVSIEGKKFCDGTKCVAQLVGQFTGADHGYVPGATYINMVLFNTLRSKWCVGLLDTTIGRGGCRCFNVARFFVYKVISATPRQVKVESVNAYDAYGKWSRRSGKFDIEDLHGLFELTFPFCHTRTFRVNLEKQAYGDQQFKKLKLQTAQKMAYNAIVKYDAANETLVIAG
jgi:hypothetical protein